MCVFVCVCECVCVCVPTAVVLMREMEGRVEEMETQVRRLERHNSSLRNRVRERGSFE